MQRTQKKSSTRFTKNCFTQFLCTRPRLCVLSKTLSLRSCTQNHGFCCAKSGRIANLEIGVLPLFCIKNDKKPLKKRKKGITTPHLRYSLPHLQNHIRARLRQELQCPSRFLQKEEAALTSRHLHQHKTLHLSAPCRAA